MMCAGITAEDCAINDLVKVYLVWGGGLHVLYSAFYGCLAGATLCNKSSRWTIVFGCSTTLVFMTFFIVTASYGSGFVWGSVGDWENRDSACDSTLLFASAVTFLLFDYLMSILLCLYPCYYCML